MMSFLISSIVSGEQFERSDTNNSFNRSFATSPELFLKNYQKTHRFSPLYFLNTFASLWKKVGPVISMNGTSLPITRLQIFWYAFPAGVLLPTNGSPGLWK